MARFEIDLTNGSNANNGISAPWKNFQPLNDGGWDGHEVSLLHGSAGVLNNFTRANVIAPGGCKITAHGDPWLPRPILSGDVGGGNYSFNPIWLKAGADITVEGVHITKSAHNGLNCIPDAGYSLARVKLRDLLLTETNQFGSYGKDALSIGAYNLNTSCEDVEVDRVYCRENNGHGIKVRGGRRVHVRDSVSIRAGLLSPSHGMGTCSNAIFVTTKLWTNVGTASGGGTIWRYNLTAADLLTSTTPSITAWSGCSINNGGPETFLMFPSVDPLNPQIGEIGIDGENNALINIGALNPSTRWVMLSYASPYEVWFDRCVTDDTYDWDGLEGQGMYFDQGSYNCYSRWCVARGNVGQGFYVHRSAYCGHYNGVSIDNGKAGAQTTLSNDVVHHGMVVVCRPGLNGLKVIAGGKRHIATRNTIVGAATGIWTSGPSNEVAEEDNRFVSCGQRLSDVSSPGLRSIDLTTLLGVSEMNAWADRQRQLCLDAI